MVRPCGAHEPHGHAEVGGRGVEVAVVVPDDGDDLADQEAGADQRRFAASGGAGAEPDHRVALGAGGFTEEAVGERVAGLAGRLGGGVEKVTGRP